MHQLLEANAKNNNFTYLDHNNRASIIVKQGSYFRKNNPPPSFNL